jgi:Arc/MetJ-type ribon-helix-helix transcriptional regulator
LTPTSAWRDGPFLEGLDLDLTLPVPRGGSMVYGMATRKITITLDEDHVQQIGRLVARRKVKSVSGFVQRATEVALQDMAGWERLLRESLDETGGPLTDNERAWADGVLGAARPTARARGRRRSA